MEQQNNSTIDLEIRITYLEDHIREMDKVMVSLENRIERLERKNKLQEQKIQELSDFIEDMPASERPPHY